MYKIGEKINALRKKNNLTQDELANKIGISKQALFNYENNKRLIPIDTLSEIAIFFNIPIESFFSENYEVFKNTDSNSIRIPIYSDASAGYGKYAQEKPLDWLELPLTIAKNADFGTFVDGDSMEPKISHNDLLLVRRTDTLEDGEIGVFYLNEEIYCKKFKFNPIRNEVILRSLNPNYSPIKLGDGDDFHIIGKVVGVLDYTI